MTQELYHLTPQSIKIGLTFFALKVPMLPHVSPPISPGKGELH